MSAGGEFQVKGWCPGILRPMESGDGLIVRVRSNCAVFDLGTLRALADAAGRHGNGHIDLTRRANLQIRGVRQDTLPLLQDDLARLGLVDESGPAEAVSNVMVSPLAGLDPQAPVDGRQLAAEITRRLCGDRRLWQLPAKFGFLVDDGSALTLDGERADIALSACLALNGAAWWRLSCDGPDGRILIGVVPDAAAANAAVDLALAFLDMAAGGAIRRMREVPPSGCAAFQSAVSSVATSTDRQYLSPPPLAEFRVGEVGRDGERALAVGLAAPFGDLRAVQLSALADALAAAGVGELRLSPWRTLYAPVTEGQSQVVAIREAGMAAGLLLDGSEPILRIEACPGAPSCSQAQLSTRELARRIAPLLATGDGDIATAHVSGCAKGCATSSRKDLMVVGRPDGCGVALHAYAQCEELAVIAADADPLPAIAATARLPYALEADTP